MGSVHEFVPKRQRRNEELLRGVDTSKPVIVATCNGAYGGWIVEKGDVGLLIKQKGTDERFVPYAFITSPVQNVV